MSEISILAIDLAKGSFQVCGVAADGAVVFNRSASRPRLYQLLAEQAHCVVAMEAWAQYTGGRDALLIRPNLRPV